MRLPIHINNAEGVGSADVDNIDPLKIGHFEDFGTVGGDELARAAGRFAACMRLELIRSAVLVEGLGPGLERRFSSRWLSRSLGIESTPSLSIRSLAASLQIPGI